MAKAYTTVPSKVTGDPISVTNWTTHLQENINNLIVPPFANAYRSTNQAIATATDDNVEFVTEGKDTDGIVDIAGDDETLTIQTAGWYLITAAVAWAANSAGHREIIVLQGIGATDIRLTTTAANSPSLTYQTATGVWNFSALDELHLQVRQTSGGNLNVTWGSLSVNWLTSS